jgi:hypothetical protein
MQDQGGGNEERESSSIKKDQHIWIRFITCVLFFLNVLIIVSS